MTIETNNSDIDFREIVVREIEKEEMRRLLYEYHCLKYLPVHNKSFLGAYLDDELVGGMSLGWGVRPRHTIQKLFPSLDTEDYRSIGRLVTKEKMPRNTESHFISKALEYVEMNFPQLELIFTWADGWLGKPGYVYQASNFYYGGYIWTEAYMTDEGERVHPRQTDRIGGRPSFEELEELGWTHYKGKMFRYVYFLGTHGERKRLLRNSDYEWTQTDYPKEDDLGWKVRTEDGWKECEKPHYDPEKLEFNEKKKEKVEWYRSHPPLESFGNSNAGEVSRERRLEHHRGDVGAVPASRTSIPLPAGVIG